MKEMINPRLFKPAVQKVRFMCRPKFYLAAVQLQGVLYLSKRGIHYKTHGAAEAYARRLLARWIRLYDAALLGMMDQVTAEVEPTLRRAQDVAPEPVGS
jgi:hypothetical protein